MTTIPMLEKELEQAYKDIKYYKNRIERLNNQLQQKENKIEKLMELYTTEREVKDYYKNIINELDNWLEENRYHIEEYDGVLTYLKHLKGILGKEVN